MNIFHIIGPVMIGPSSSHTAGAVRIGNAGRMLLGQEVCEAEILLSGSFAETGKGHGTDKALVAGILGMQPDDERIRDSMEYARKAGLSYKFEVRNVEDSHPNTAVLRLKAKDGSQTSIQASSIGGGNIHITRVNDMPVQFSGQYTTMIVLHHDVPGVIEQVASFLADEGINIATFQSVRSSKGGLAIMTIEVDGTIPKATAAQLNEREQVVSCVIVDKIL